MSWRRKLDVGGFVCQHGRGVPVVPSNLEPDGKRVDDDVDSIRDSMNPA
jgi:hypothetical protein